MVRDWTIKKIRGLNKTCISRAGGEGGKGGRRSRNSKKKKKKMNLRSIERKGEPRWGRPRGQERWPRDGEGSGRWRAWEGDGSERRWGWKVGVRGKRRWLKQGWTPWPSSWLLCTLDFTRRGRLSCLLNVGWLTTYRVRICSSDISDYLLYRIRICFSSHMISDYLLSLVPGQQWTKSVATANGLMFLFGDKQVLHLKFIDKI